MTENISPQHIEQAKDELPVLQPEFMLGNRIAVSSPSLGEIEGAGEHSVSMTGQTEARLAECNNVREDEALSHGETATVAADEASTSECLGTPNEGKVFVKNEKGTRTTQSELPLQLDGSSSRFTSSGGDLSVDNAKRKPVVQEPCPEIRQDTVGGLDLEHKGEADEQARMRDAKLQKLRFRIKQLEDEIEEAEYKIEATQAQLVSPIPPESIIATHIKTLHRYNEIRDVGLGLLNMIADSRGVRAVEVYREFGIEKND